MKNKPHYIICHLIYFLSLCFSSTYGNQGYSDIQECYLASEPLPKIVAKLKNAGMSDEQIASKLKKDLEPVIITPRLAKEIFNIDWQDNSIKKEHLVDLENLINEELVVNKVLFWPLKYPPLVICYIDEKVGYGLFSLVKIEKGDPITEYAGRFINNRNRADNEITLSSDTKNCYRAQVFAGEIIDIDAQKQGNAGRFAQHMLSEDDIAFYNWHCLNKEIDIATRNADFFPYGDENERHLMLVAIKDIEPYEQIGIKYSETIGYEGSIWPTILHLFNKQTGEVIPYNECGNKYSGVLLLDKYSNERYPVLLRVAEFVRILTDPNQTKDINGYSIVDLGYVKIVANTEELMEQFKNFPGLITISVYLLHTNKEIKINSFVSLLKSMSGYNISEADKKAIVLAAENNDFTKAKHLLDVAKNKIFVPKKEL